VRRLDEAGDASPQVRWIFFVAPCSVSETRTCDSLATPLLYHRRAVTRRRQRRGGRNTSKSSYPRRTVAPGRPRDSLHHRGAEALSGLTSLVHFPAATRSPSDRTCPSSSRSTRGPSISTYDLQSADSDAVTISCPYSYVFLLIASRNHSTIWISYGSVQASNLRVGGSRSGLGPRSAIRRSRIANPSRRARRFAYL